MKRHRQPLRIMSDINVTNLLDTAFILIIALMLVAPQLTHGLKIDLPTAVETAPLDNPQDKTLLIAVQPKGEGFTTERITFQNLAVTVEELHSKLVEAFARDPKLIVQVDADRACAYGVVFEVLDAVKRAGIDNIDLASGPPAPPEASKDKDEQRDGL